MGGVLDTQKERGGSIEQMGLSVGGAYPFYTSAYPMGTQGSEGSWNFGANSPSNKIFRLHFENLDMTPYVIKI